MDKMHTYQHTFIKLFWKGSGALPQYKNEHKVALFLNVTSLKN